jgi:Fe2+ transport system protein FeoA
MNSKTLSSLRENTWARVTQIQPGPIAPRLVEMGFFEGSEVRVLYKAPFKGPLAVDLGASVVALRQSEAEMVWVVDEKRDGA